MPYARPFAQSNERVRGSGNAVPLIARPLPASPNDLGEIVREGAIGLPAHVEPGRERVRTVAAVHARTAGEGEPLVRMIPVGDRGPVIRHVLREVERAERCRRRAVEREPETLRAQREIVPLPARQLNAEIEPARVGAELAGLRRRDAGERAVALVARIARGVDEPAEHHRRRTDRRELGEREQPAARTARCARPVAARKARGELGAEETVRGARRRAGQRQGLRDRRSPAQLREIAGDERVAVVAVREPGLVGEREAGCAARAAACGVLDDVPEIPHRSARDEQRRRGIVAAVLQRRGLLREARRLQRAETDLTAERAVSRARADRCPAEQVGVDPAAGEGTAGAGDRHAVDAGTGLRGVVAVDHQAVTCRRHARQVAERVTQRTVEIPQCVVLTDLTRRARRRAGDGDAADLLQHAAALQPHAHARRTVRRNVEERRARRNEAALRDHRAVRAGGDRLEARMPVGIGVADRTGLALEQHAGQRDRGSRSGVDDVDHDIARIGRRACRGGDRKHRDRQGKCRRHGPGHASNRPPDRRWDREEHRNLYFRGCCDSNVRRSSAAPAGATLSSWIFFSSAWS